MKSEDFVKLCKENGLEVGDMPAFPPEMTDEQWEWLIKALGEDKKKRNS